MAYAGRQELLGIERAEDLDELGNNSGPAGLVAGAQARAGVAVEVLVEENVVSPVGIGLERLGGARIIKKKSLVAKEDSQAISSSPQ